MSLTYTHTESVRRGGEEKRECIDVGLNPELSNSATRWYMACMFVSLFLSHSSLTRMQRPYMVVGGRRGDNEMRGGGGSAHASMHPIFDSARLASARLGANAHAPRAMRLVDLRNP